MLSFIANIVNLQYSISKLRLRFYCILYLLISNLVSIFENRIASDDQMRFRWKLNRRTVRHRLRSL